MIHDLPMSAIAIGRTLRHWRRQNNVKQSAVAEMLGISQAGVSRCESGQSRLTEREKRALIRLLGAQSVTPSDQAVVDLVANSSEPMHLVCDLTHRLLAASPRRLATIRRSIDELRGRSLWFYASKEIVMAERSLPDLGWFDETSAEIRFETGFHDCATLWIESSTIIWTRIPLSNGTVARLVRNET